MTAYVNSQTIEGDASVLGVLANTGWQQGFRTQGTTASTLTLTVADNHVQEFTGATAGQAVKLPSSLTLRAGQRYDIYNFSTATVDIQDGAGTVLISMQANSVCKCLLRLVSGTAGTWALDPTFLGTLGSLLNYTLTSQTSFATTSNTDVVITSFTTTPVSGTYLVLVNINGSASTGSAVTQATIYNGGVANSDSLRTAKPGAATTAFFTCLQATIQFDGTKACDVRVNTSAGTYTVTNRNLTLFRLGA